MPTETAAAPTPAPQRAAGQPIQQQTVEGAIAHVLEAEREANQAVATAEVEAAAMVERTRADVRALDARTERRIGAVRAAFEQQTLAAIATLDRQGAGAGAGHALTAADLGLVQATVDALAQALITDGRDGG